MSCARVSGSSSRRARPAATISSTSTSRSCFPNGLPLQNIRSHDALHGRPQGEAVPVGDEVDRPAHERHPHRLAALDQALELLRPEALDARPERDVGVARLLRLQADQVLDHLGGRPFRPPEQSLALQQGPVELASS